RHRKDRHACERVEARGAQARELLVDASVLTAEGAPEDEVHEALAGVDARGVGAAGELAGARGEGERGVRGGAVHLDRDASGAENAQRTIEGAPHVARGELGAE